MNGEGTSWETSVKRELYERIEPALAYARACLRVGSTAEAREALEAARDLVDLYRQPAYASYKPDAVIEDRQRVLSNGRHVLAVEAVSPCIGDGEQVGRCIAALVRNVELGPESVLVVEVFQDDVPVVTLTFDGPGRFPAKLSFAGYPALGMEELAERWTLATRGGRIDKTRYGLTLRLEGIREPPPFVEGLDPLIARLDEAIAAAEPAGALEAALAIVDGEHRPPEPADVAALLANVMKERRPTLEHHGLAFETLCDRTLPPVVISRARFIRFLDNLVNYAVVVLPPGAGGSMLLDYDSRNRNVGMVVVMDGVPAEPAALPYLASMRRAIEEGHGGTFDLSADGGAATITVTLPDPVGRVLDEWLPGFEVFSDRSKQMLRLLKSGGQTPPADLLLEGILHDELERWLLPGLAQALAVNLAHDLAPTPGALPGASADRLAKALAQIKRGKPRKEIAKPPYAAEILWAYRIDERHRKAVGTEHLDEDALRRLCTGLLETPPAYVECLRIIARALTG